jgi:hypothetical protein
MDSRNEISPGDQDKKGESSRPSVLPRSLQALALLKINEVSPVTAGFLKWKQKHNPPELQCMRLSFPTPL